MSQFTHLHVHTEYSILDGIAKVSKLVNKALDDGMTALAITDHGNMYGVLEFYLYIKEKLVDGIKKKIKTLEKEGKNTSELQEKLERAKNFKPIIGCEMYIAAEGRASKDRGNHLILLAKNKVGYHNLVRLVSLGFTEGFYARPRIDFELLEKYKEGLICCSACIGGEIPHKIRVGNIEGAKEAALRFKSWFGDDFYLEIQRLETNRADANHEVFEIQKKINPIILDIGRELSIKVIATNDVHFLNEEDADAQERLLCINTGKTMADAGRMLYTKQEFLKTQTQMAEIFADIPEVLQTTMEIADKVEHYAITEGAIMPEFPLPEPFKEDSEYLIHLTYEGAKERYKTITEAIKERIDFELNTINNMGFPGYFLIVQDFIGYARQNGIFVGPGRGSAAGSVVAYCLKITDVDPLAYDLLFERFLNPDRISMPDIDIDFDVEGRDKVLQYVAQKYGQDRVARIVTFGTMAAKLALKDVARVHNLPIPESNRLAKFIDEIPSGEPVTIDSAIHNVFEMKNAVASDDKVISETIKYAQKLEGTVRGHGIHACGVIIGKNSLMNHIPISTDRKEENILIAQYESSLIESAGMLKMDFLGLKNLSIIKMALENIKLNKGIEVDINKIPFDDPKTYHLYGEGDTMGTFQFESDGMQKHLRVLKPERFEDLIAMNALYRPGPMSYIPDFIERKHGRKPVTYDIPVMEKYLKDTYGITIYQEQVMLLSRELAGFTPGESDELRKVMGKKLVEKLPPLKEKFLAGCMKNGHNVKVVEKIWEDWTEFAKYAFNKSHSTCYSYVAYQTAWLKANYPAEYMATLLTYNSTNVEDLSKYMEECRRMGINILSPNVNESYRTFSANKEGDIRFGMSAIKGVGESIVDMIVTERDKNGLFTDLYNFVERMSPLGLNRRTIESLALCGAFDDFKIPRVAYLYSPVEDGPTFVDGLVKYAQLFNPKTPQIQKSIFGETVTHEMLQKPIPPTVEEWNKIEMLHKEKELVGMYLSSHPLDEYRIIINHCITHTTEDLKDLANPKNRQFTIAGVMGSVQHLFTKTGNPYGRFHIEDYKSSIEFLLFGKDYIQASNYLKNGLLVVIKGIVQEKPWGRKDSHTPELEMKIQSIDLLPEYHKNKIKKLTFSLPLGNISESLVMQLDGLCNEHQGTIKLYFKITDAENNTLSLFSQNKKVELDNDLFDFCQKHQITYHIG